MERDEVVVMAEAPRSHKEGSCYVHPALLLGHPANSEVAKLSFRNSYSGRHFFQKHSGIPFFRKLSGRRICDFRKYSETPSGRTSSRMFLEEASSGRYPFTSGRRVFRKLVFFKKMFYFVIIYF